MFCWTAQSHMELSYFRLFLADIFANLSLQLVYSQLKQFGRGGGGADAVVIKQSP